MFALIFWKSCSVVLPREALAFSTRNGCSSFCDLLVSVSYPSRARVQQGEDCSQGGRRGRQRRCHWCRPRPRSLQLGCFILPVRLCFTFFVVSAGLSKSGSFRGAKKFLGLMWCCGAQLVVTCTRKLSVEEMNLYFLSRPEISVEAFLQRLINK